MLSSIKSPQDLKKLSGQDLKFLSQEIRDKIIHVMTQNGGHLASNLGVVELTIALHYVFNAPQDTLIFDVGHQCYTHKLLTGRCFDFDQIRKKGGVSGFMRKKESIYDPVDTGHCSTSISSGIGFAVAKQLLNNNSHVIVVIGDGALTGGEAFEAMNFTGHKEIPLIVILNDNEMSINQNVGAVSKFLNKLAVSNFYQRLIELFDRKLQKASGPIKTILRLLYKIKRGLKYIVEYENVFTNLGFEYIGPVNGHNLQELIYMFEHTKKNIKHPVLLHVKTIKGKGYPMAENDPTLFHGVTPLIMKAGKIEPALEKTFTDIFSNHLLSMGKKYPELVAITAAMEIGTGLDLFKKYFPNRFFDVGIAEQHAVTFSAALAFGGLRPVLALYSTFLLRAIDQLIQDICISESPVIIAIDRAGIVGADGETHQGQFDISYLKMIPNLVIMAPSDAKELELMLDYAYSLKKPVAIRYPKAVAEESQLLDHHPDLQTHPQLILKEGTDILIIVIGPFVQTVELCIRELEKQNINAGLIYLRILKPLDEKILMDEIIKYKRVLVIEENVYSGSVSQDIAGLIASEKTKIQFSSINLPDEFIEHDTRSNILKRLGFDQKGIMKVVNRLLNPISLFIPN